MGIEPFLLIFIVAGMFLVQAARALREALMDRLQFSLETGREVKALALRTHMHRTAGSDHWRAGAADDDVELVYAPFPALRIRQLVTQATGVRPPLLSRHLAWLAPSVLVLVRFPAPLLKAHTPLRIASSSTAVPDADRVQLHNVVLDQVLRVRTEAPDEVRRLLSDRAVHEPLLELLATHPMSVVTEQVVALWCTRAVADPEPLVTLAVEVAHALRQATQPQQTTAQS
ncbi:MAG: hypothetical protein KTR31_12360 [Myxococcales bacterium]|nr:hypothetical protein [Myxococcales bacterium]